MYQREILKPGPSPVAPTGEFMRGTWNGAFREVDFLAIKKPYRVPIVRWARETRLKEWESFLVESGPYHLDAFIANLKWFRIAQVVLYDKESGERFRFRKILPLSGWNLPKKLGNGAIESRSWGFFFRIHNWLDADTIRIDLDIKERYRRPALTAHLAFETAGAGPLCTTSAREGLPCYNYKTFAPVHGDMVWGGRHIVFKPEATLGFFRDSKGFYRYFSHHVWCTAAGRLPKESEAPAGENPGEHTDNESDGSRFAFSLAEQPPFTGRSQEGNDRNCHNVFWTGGLMTPLPPVRITAPEGWDAKWIIQDVEGMVDLSFTPKVGARSAFNLAAFGAEYRTPLGFFSGFLLNSKGERAKIKNLWGLGEVLSLRV
jgi:hypothetical protein